MEVFVTDTMAIVLRIEKRKMPQKTKAIFEKIEKGEIILHIPAMVLVEIGYLSERKRIEIALGDIAVYLEKHQNVRVHAMDIELVKNAFEINDIPELHDRRIAATAKLFGYPLITNDPEMISSKFVATVWD